MVSGALDVKGNLQVARTVPDVFSIDTQNPTLVSIEIFEPEITNAPIVDFRVTFSEPVENVNRNVNDTEFDFVLVTDVGGASIVSVAGSGATYIVKVNTGTTDGTINLDLVTTPTINDLKGNLLDNMPVSGVDETYTMGTTEVLLVDGKLSITDIRTLTADYLTLSSDGTNLQIDASGSLIAIGPGVVRVDFDTVLVPLVSIPDSTDMAGVFVVTRGLNDVVNIEGVGKGLDIVGGDGDDDKVNFQSADTTTNGGSLSVEAEVINIQVARVSTLNLPDDSMAGDVTFAGNVTLYNDVEIVAGDKTILFTGDVKQDMSFVALTLTADEIDFSSTANSVQGISRLTLQPFKDDRAIRIGTLATADVGLNDGILDIETRDIDALADGVQQIFIGRSTGEHAITVGEASFKDAITLRSPNSGGNIRMEGQLDTLASTTENADAVITLDTRTIFLAAEVVTPGARIESKGDLMISSATDALLDTTAGGAVVGGARIEIKKSLDGDATNPGEETLGINAGTLGDVIISSELGAKIGSNKALNLTLINSNSTTFVNDAVLLTVDIQDTSDTITFQQNATLETLETADKGYNVAFMGDMTRVTNDTTFKNTGEVTLGDGAGDTTTFVGGLDTTTGPSMTKIAGNVRTTGQEIRVGELELINSATIDTTNDGLNQTGALVALGNVNGGSFTLNANAGTMGSIVIDQNSRFRVNDTIISEEAFRPPNADAGADTVINGAQLLSVVLDNAQLIDSSLQVLSARVEVTIAVSVPDSFGDGFGYWINWGDQSDVTPGSIPTTPPLSGSNPTEQRSFSTVREPLSRLIIDGGETQLVSHTYNINPSDTGSFNIVVTIDTFGALPPSLGSGRSGGPQDLQQLINQEAVGGLQFIVGRDVVDDRGVVVERTRFPAFIQATIEVTPITAIAFGVIPVPTPLPETVVFSTPVVAPLEASTPDRLDKTIVTSSRSSDSQSSQYEEERYYILRIVSLDENGLPRALSGEGNDIILETKEANSSETESSTENPKVAEALRPFSISKLPELFSRLPDDHYQLFLFEDGTERLVLDFKLREGQPIEVPEDFSDEEQGNNNDDTETPSQRDGRPAKESLQFPLLKLPEAPLGGENRLPWPKSEMPQDRSSLQSLMLDDSLPITPTLMEQLAAADFVSYGATIVCGTTLALTNRDRWKASIDKILVAFGSERKK